MKPAFGGLSHLSCATSSPTPVGLSSSPKPVYLRPSQLMLGSIESPQQGTSQNPSPLKPPSLGNPFARGKFVQSFLISNVKTVQNIYSVLFWFHCMSYPLNSSIFFFRYHLHILRITCGMTLYAYKHVIINQEFSRSAEHCLLRSEHDCAPFWHSGSYNYVLLFTFCNLMPPWYILLNKLIRIM